jgi:PAS domain S-box-containing protein
VPFNRFTVFGCAVLAAICLFVGWNLREQREVSGWVDHTYLVIQESQGVLADIVEAETSQRGFLITSLESYLLPYRDALASLPRHIRELRSLTADNPPQQKRLDQLEALANTRLTLLADVIQVFRERGPEPAREYLLGHPGQKSMDAIRSLLAQFEGEENALLNSRIQRRSRNSRSIVLGVTCSLLLAFTFFFVAARQHRRIEAETESASRSREELRILQRLVEQAPMGILMLDRHLRQIQVSQLWLDDFGLTREAVLGKSYYETFPNSPQHWIEMHRRALAGETVFANDERYVAPDGSEHWVNRRVTPWGDSGETTGGIVIYSEDITRRKLAEASARRHELQYRVLFENMPDAVAYCQMILEWDKPADFIYLAVNSGFSSLTGASDVVGRRMSDLTSPYLTSGVDPALLEMYGRVSRTGVPEKLDYHSEHNHKWLHLSVFSPEEQFFVVITQDITQRKEEEAIARQWQRAFENSQSGIALVNVVTGKISAANPAYSKNLGYTAEELASQDIALLYPESALAHRQAVLVAAEETEQSHVLFETLHVRKDGTCFPVLVDTTIIRDDAGTPISHVKIVHDLTEIKRTGEALRASEARARSLFENAGQGILIADAEGRIVDANAMVQRLFGYTASELIGQPAEMLMARSTQSGPRANYWSQPDARHTGQAIELVGLRRDRSEFPVEVSLSYVAELQDGLSIAFVSDITERKQVDAALRESESQFRTLANAIPNLCWMANADGWFFWYNQRWFDYTGSTSEQVEGWSWASLLEATKLPEVIERWTASIASGTPFEMVLHIRGADGVFRPFLSRGMPVKNSAGKVVRWFGANTDISEQLQNEQVLRSRTQQLEAANEHLKRTGDALRASEARARSLFENAGQGILTTDVEGRIVDANAMVERLFGYTPSELIGSSVEMLLPPALRRRYAGYRSRARYPNARHVRQGMDLIALRKDGAKFPVEVSLSFVGEQHDGLSIAFVSDITARKKAEREREDLIARLEDALGEKTVLLQEVHHRVKNNLAIIAALLGMQSSAIEDDRAKVAFEASQHRVLSMARIHEFLYATKNLDRVAFRKYLEKLTGELCDSYSVSTSINVSIEAEDIDLPMDQAIPCGLILNELLSNTLKYAFPEGRAGSIVVRFVRLSSGTLSLSCSDDGIGMPETFHWGTAKSLGLRIVRILSKQIDGELTMHSGSGGTKFELRFNPAQTDLAGGRVLSSAQEA